MEGWLGCGGDGKVEKCSWMGFGEVESREKTNHNKVIRLIAFLDEFAISITKDKRQDTRMAWLREERRGRRKEEEKRFAGTVWGRGNMLGWEV